MASKSDQTDVPDSTWKQKGTRLHPNDAKAWDELMESENLVQADILRLFMRRFIKDPEVRKQFS